MYKEKQAQLAADVCQHINDAESYASYAGMVARRFEKSDIYSKWIVAIVACGPFIDKLTIESANTAAWVIALIPLVSIALPLLNYSKKVELASTLHSQYVGILPDLKDLWRRICSNKDPSLEELDILAGTLSTLEKKISEIRVKKSEMPSIPSLVKKAESKSRKLNIPDYLVDDNFDVDEDMEEEE